MFAGIGVPLLCKRAGEYQTLALPEIIALLRSTVHESRLPALIIMALLYAQSRPSQRRHIFLAHLENTRFINNWDLLDERFSIEVLTPAVGVPRSWIGLRVIFPEDVPTHCRQQTFYFDESRFLRRLDYIAEVVGSWAHAAHFCEDYIDFGGIKAPTRRRVLPRLVGSRPLPVPLLVGIDLHALRPV